MPKRHAGITLVEALVTVTLVAVVFAMTFGIYMQAARIYTRTSVRIEPQHSLMLAMKKMESDIREAMFIRIGSNASMVEIALPRKDANGMILMTTVVMNSQTGLSTIGRIEGKHVCYFLGRPDASYPNRAIPDALYGNTIYKITTGSNSTTGADIIRADGTLNAYYTGAVKMVSGVLSRPMITNPSTGQEVAGTIFSYAGSSGTSTSPQGLSAQIVRISLSVPVQVSEGNTRVTRNHNLSTEFCLRNFESLN